MRAIVQYKYGAPEDVLRRRYIDIPELEDDEVLVRVHAASVHPDVWHVVQGWPFILRAMGSGLLKPKKRVPGTDMAGIIESVGRDVTRFQPGDEVFGETVRGYQWQNGGAFAEYVAVPEAGLALKPANVTFERAAAVPTSALIALQGVRDQGRVQPGQKVLVNGAGGGVGAFAVQLAKAYGAEVTAVDSSGKLDMLRSLGADQVVDYTQEDFTQGAERYDVIVDIPGNHPFSEVRRVLTLTGTYVLIAHDQYGQEDRHLLGSVPRVLKLAALSPFVDQLPELNFSMPAKMEAMAELSALMEAGKLTPVIDRTYPLGKVPEAIAYLETGDVQGKVVITVGPPQTQ